MNQLHQGVKPKARGPEWALESFGKYEGGLYANGHLYYTKVIK